MIIFKTTLPKHYYYYYCCNVIFVVINSNWIVVEAIESVFVNMCL